jgi:hypothetical protein
MEKVITAQLPGMNECTPSPSDCRQLELIWKPLTERKLILMATATIQTENLFQNGLYQNIFILYKMFDSMGYAPILLVNDKPKDINTVPIILRHVRMMTVEEVARTPLPVHLYLEIGMSVDKGLRKIFRMTGAKVAKLYLGNILNIDIETPVFYREMNFSHHVIGELDEIWVSPHYKQHEEYAAAINNVRPFDDTMKIAPYVWDPCILTLNGTRDFKWRPRRANEIETFLILEPNISFQKGSLIPLLIAERNYRQNKRPLRVLVGNGERLMANPFFTRTILPTLELAKDNCIDFSGRHTITNILNEYPYAVAIGHQWNNQYNYMALEFAYSGFPFIHNAPDWRDLGYYYEGNDIDEGLKSLNQALQRHSTDLEMYKARTEAVRWRHSPYNPDVQEAWSKLL